MYERVPKTMLIKSHL